MIAYFALFGRVILLGCEKILVKKLGEKADSVSCTFLFFAMGSAFLLPFIFFVESPKSFSFLRFVILSSFIYTFSFVLYVKSLSQEEVSLVSPLYNFNVFFLLILTVIFLNENLSFFKVMGLALLIYGASFLNRQKNVFQSLKALILNKFCLYMLTSSFLIAIGRTIDGFVVQDFHPVIYAFCIYSSISLFLLLYQLTTRTVNRTVTLLKDRLSISVGSGAVNAYSYLFLLFAFREIEVSIAEPTSMLGMIVTVLLAGKIFKETINERLIGVLIMVIATWLLFL